MLKYKKLIISFILFSIVFLLIMLCKINFESVKSTLDIFLTSVFPSLFPFILLTELILKTDSFVYISKYFALLPKLFKLSKNTSVPILIGFLCGFPSGAKAIEDYYSKGYISYRQAYILNIFVHNPSPIFILSTIGIAILNNISIGIILLISNILSSLIIGIFFSNTNIIHEANSFLNTSNKKSSTNCQNSFDILRICIRNTLLTLGYILAFMIIFSLIADIICYYASMFTSNKYILSIINAIFELTKGVNQLKNLSNYYISIPLIAFFIGFNGLSVIFQIKSSYYTFKISLQKIVFFKLINGIMSSIISYILLRYTNIAKLNTLSVFSSIDLNNSSIHNMYNIYFYFSLLTIFVVSAYLIFSYIRKEKFNLNNFFEIKNK